MGRGRAKAKQTKVARDLKYRTFDTDFSSLERELRGDRGDSPASEQDEYDDEYEEYDAYDDPDAEDDDEDDQPFHGRNVV